MGDKNVAYCKDCNYDSEGSGGKLTHEQCDGTIKARAGFVGCGFKEGSKTCSDTSKPFNASDYT
jgi:hypothetical protein